MAPPAIGGCISRVAARQINTAAGRTIAIGTVDQAEVISL